MKPEFLWGVATSAYQAEGGYNGTGEPQTNWAMAEQREEVASLGLSADFWHRYEEDFARCRALGLSAFRLSIEWSRVQPTVSTVPGDPPSFDFSALDHYVKIIRACLDHGMEPIVTLHHFVHPAWLGPDAWLEERTAKLFSHFVHVAVSHLNEGLPRPIQWFVTINEPNMLVLNSYFGRQFPAERSGGLHTMMEAYNQLMRAHVLAYRALHALYRQRSWPPPSVSFNNYCSDVYWSDKLLLDLACARERGVPRVEVGAYIRRQAKSFDQALRAARLPLHRDLAYFGGVFAKWLGNFLGYRLFSTAPFATFLDELYSSKDVRILDYIGLDYYDPFAAHAFRLPVLWDHEFKNRSWRSWVLATVTSKWWDWRVLPRGLHFFCRYYAQDFGRKILIAENGMALRWRKDDRRPRKDRITRSEFLRLHVGEVLKIVREGVPLIGYMHWSLFDNYEWGTYTPRFGLYSIDFARGTDRQPADPYGDQPSATYAALIKQARERALDPNDCPGLWRLQL